MNVTTLPADLTDDEIDTICDGLRQNAAKIRFLRNTLGLTVGRKPNGRPLVNRAHYDAVRSAGKAGHGSAAHAPVWGVHG